MARISTGLASAILGQYGLTRMMNSGHICLYSGVPPGGADEKIEHPLIGQVTSFGLPVTGGIPTNGLRITQSIPGRLSGADDWYVRVINSGTPTWWRWKWYMPDDDKESLYYPRMDGNVGRELVLETTNLLQGQIMRIAAFNVSFMGF
jgi:hypothetical protein